MYYKGLYKLIGKTPDVEAEEKGKLNECIRNCIEMIKENTGDVTTPKPPNMFTIEELLLYCE